MAILPKFRAERCTRYRYRYSACKRCEDACPHDAIALSEEGASIDPAKCRDCALCVAACPTEAWISEKIPSVQIIKRALAKADKSFRIACIPSGAEGDERVPCLGAIDATLLAFLASRGIETGLAGAWHCDDCIHGSRGQRMIEFARDGAQALRGNAGGAAWAEIRLVEPPEGDVPVLRVDDSRRQLFRRIFGSAAARIGDSSGPRPAVPPRAIRAAPPYSTVRRELIQAVWPATEEGDVSLDDALPLNAFSVTNACNQCELCARACPTGALAIVENDLAWSLEFEFSRCVGCDVCLEACQPDALRRLPRVAAPVGRTKKPQELRQRAKRRCDRCDRFYMPAREADFLCAVCDGDDKDFAAMFG